MIQKSMATVMDAVAGTYVMGFNSQFPCTMGTLTEYLVGTGYYSEHGVRAVYVCICTVGTHLPDSSSVLRRE